MGGKTDPVCGRGIKGQTSEGAEICCPKSCTRCGGSDCGKLPGGSDNCCGGPITAANKFCAKQEAPCLIKKAPAAAKTDPGCAKGLKGQTSEGAEICCPKSCN